MSKVLQSNGDLVLRTRSTGGPSIPADIILDPSEDRIVRITGTLVVEGETVSVAAEDLSIEDNFITINIGETGAGVSLQYSGLQVDRGTLPPANLLWDENIQAWTFVTGEEGAYNFSNNNVVLATVKTNAAANGGNLTLIGSGTGVITVAGTVNYENQVTDDDHIPNKKYVDDQIVNAPGHSIAGDDTFVIIADSNIPAGEPGSVSSFTTATGHFTEGDQSAVSIIVNGSLNSQFYDSKAVIQNLEVSTEGGFEAVLQNKNEGSNLYFKTNTTGKIQTNYALQLDRHTSVPAVVAGSTLVYANAAGTGGTGIYFVNDGADTSSRNDELISKKKALVYSMIF